jgi:hypothetical protein
MLLFGIHAIVTPAVLVQARQQEVMPYEMSQCALHLLHGRNDSLFQKPPFRYTFHGVLCSGVLRQVSQNLHRFWFLNRGDSHSTSPMERNAFSNGDANQQFAWFWGE